MTFSANSPYSPPFPKMSEQSQALGVRQMVLKWLVFLIGPLYLFGMWFTEDHKANSIKINIQKEIGLRYS
jgi:hypothetical protein